MAHDGLDVSAIGVVVEDALPVHAAAGRGVALQIQPDEVRLPVVDELIGTSIDLDDVGRRVSARVAASRVVKVGAAAVKDLRPEINVIAGGR
jgi:hypothetical protein